MVIPEGKYLADLSCFSYQIEDISIIAWLYILLERKGITVVHDIHATRAGNSTVAPVTMSIVLQFPHYNTWLEFQAFIEGQPIKYVSVFDERGYTTSPACKVQ